MTETDASVRTGDTLCLPLEIKAVAAGGAPGEFEGYGSVFGNRDRDGDVVLPGAFADSLKKRMPALLWQHNQKEPIGVFSEVREDERGLFVRGRLAMSGRGKEAYDLLKMGALKGLSIGFVTKEASRNPAMGTRTIHRAELMEVSLVTFPANDEARVATVKSVDADAPISDARSFERMLRENGFSRSRAKAITAKGFKGHFSETDERVEIAEVVRELKCRQLVLNRKGFREEFQLLAPPKPLGRWSNWYRLKGVTSHPRLKSSFSMKFTSVSDLSGPFEIQVDYVGPKGRKLEKLLTPSSAEFVLPLNSIQEPKVRARSLTINGQLIRVLKYGS